jgi:hypothetical protein
MYITPIIDLLRRKSQNLCGKYAKQTLTRLEELKLPIDQYKMIRKIVLDSYNDYKREIEETCDRLIEAD